MTSRPPALAGLPLLEDLPPLKGKKVLVRTDFNAPLTKGPDGTVRVADTYRITSALPTLRWLLDQGAHVTACSHLGRPANDSYDERYVMTPIRRVLDELCPQVTLLENLRFSAGEAANDPAFVSDLMDSFDAYVNEAFGVSHRAHGSVVGPPASLPSAAGRELAHEVEILGGLFHKPARPFVAVVGGAKVADKLGVLEALAPQVDTLAIGGAMAYTFLVAAGHKVGNSLVDESHLDQCRRLLDAGVKILLPSDSVALPSEQPFGAGEDGAGAMAATTFDDDIAEGFVGLDIGAKSAKSFAAAIADAKTVLWNGPLGVVEDSRFVAGTRTVAQAVADCGGFTVVGGGDSVSAIEHLGLGEKINFLSTGGGAALEFMEFGDLPGLKALRNAPNAPKGTR